MKVLVYTSAFAPMVGGQETILMLLAKGLSQHGSRYSAGNLDVTLVTPTPAKGFNDEGLGFRVVRHPRFALLIRLMRESDVIHVAGPTFLPIILALLLNKPVVIEHHGFQAICPNGQLFLERTKEQCPGHFMAKNYGQCIRCNSAKGTFQTWFMWLTTFPRRWLCQRVSVNILPTRWLGTQLKLNRMQTIVHGLPSAAGVPRAPVKPVLPTFIFLGRLVTTKGTGVLLEAAQRLKRMRAGFRVRIIGKGPERLALERRSEELKVNDCVEFQGYIPDVELDEQLANATAVVMPSLAGEVFGLSAAENMQRGRLVIVSDIGSLSEVVGDAGMIFARGDAEGLAHCMQAAISDPSRCDDLRAKAASRIAQAFTFDEMIRGHIRCYEELHKH